MKQPSLPFKLKVSSGSSAKMTSFGGVPLVIELYRALELDRIVERFLHLKQQGWKESAIIEALIALQVAGGECMEDMETFDADEVKALSGYTDLPSSSTVRRFLHLFDVGVSDDRELGEAVVPEENEQLKALNEAHRHVLCKLLEHEQPSRMTLDADATVIQSQKRSCLATYKGGRGYQPIQGVWAEKQVVVAEEFRDGNVPANFDALAFLKKCRSNLPVGTEFCLRSDGAWYQWDVMEYCTEEGIPFAISADLSHGLMRFVHAISEEKWKPLQKITVTGREKTDLEYAELEFSTAALSKAEIRQRMLQYRYIVTRKKNEQPDLFEGAYHYEAVCTNMNWKAERLIWWHHERCGSVEQVIDRLKHDFAGNTFPCGTFGANAAWWRITCIAYNLVQALKIIALPFGWFSHRMKRLRFKLFCVAGRIIRHARQTFLHLARGDPLITIYNEARQKITALA